MSKPFSEVLAKKYEPEAIKAVQRYYLAQHGRRLTDKPFGIYGADLGDEKAKILIEVEVKTDWKCGEFPFLDLRITNRKRKLLREIWTPYKQLEFWVLSDSLTRAAIVDGFVYRNAKVESIFVKTVGFESYDTFRIIPKNEIRMFVNLRKPDGGQRVLVALNPQTKILADARLHEYDDYEW